MTIKTLAWFNNLKNEYYDYCWLVYAAFSEIRTQKEAPTIEAEIIYLDATLFNTRMLASSK